MITTKPKRKRIDAGEAKKVTIPGEESTLRIKRGASPPAEHLAADEAGPEPEPRGLGWTCGDCGEPISIADHLQHDGLCPRCDPEQAGRGDWDKVAEVEPPPVSFNGVVYCPGCSERGLRRELPHDRWSGLGGPGVCEECQQQGFRLEPNHPLMKERAAPKRKGKTNGHASREVKPASPTRGDPSDWVEMFDGVHARIVPPGATSTTTPAGITANNADGPVSPPFEQGDREDAKLSRPSRLSGESVPETSRDANAPAAASDVESRLMPLADIARNRFNPRENFDPEELMALAGSLSRHDMILPVVVRPIAERRDALTGNPGARHEIVAGERRALAALKAGWAEIPVRVINCDDARACELAIAENRDRKDISQVEYARGLQRLADLKGLDPKGLAEDQGLSEQHVRNLFRLLKAPQAWQEHVIQGRLSGTHLRHALPFLHVKAVEKDLLKQIDENLLDGQLAMSEKRWRKTVEESVRSRAARLSRSVSVRHPQWKYSDVRIDAKDPRYAELDIVELPPRWGGKPEKLALNRKLANQILSEKAKAWQERNGGGKKGKQGPTPAELKKQAAAEKKQRREKLEGLVRYWLSWLCSRALREADDSAMSLRVLLAANYDCTAAMLAHDSANRWAYAELTGGKKDHGYFRGDGPPPKTFLSLTDASLHRWVKEVAARSFWPAEGTEEEQFERRRWPEGIDEQQAEWLRLLNVKPEGAWRSRSGDGKQQFLGPLTSAWLEMHDRTQLAELAAEWKVPVLDKDSDNAVRLKLVRTSARAMPMPAELAEIVAGCKGAKAKRKPR